MQTIGERLKMVREAHRMPQDRFAQMIGTTSSAISRYEGGLRGVPVPIIMSICREFNVNRAWLETGEGEMMAETQSRTLDRIAARYGKSDILRSVLDVYADLTDDEQDAVDRYIRLCASAIANDQVPNAAAAETSESLEAGVIGAVRENAAQLDQAAQ